jgi:hypothetical protein
MASRTSARKPLRQRILDCDYLCDRPKLEGVFNMVTSGPSGLPEVLRRLYDMARNDQPLKRAKDNMISIVKLFFPDSPIDHIVLYELMCREKYVN